MSDGVGSAVRRLRLAQGRTLEDVAAAAGIHRVTLITIEQRRADTTFDTGCRLGRALKHRVMFVPYGIDVPGAIPLCDDEPEAVAV